MIEKSISSLSNLSHRVYRFFCPQSEEDILHTTIQSQGKVTAFFLSQILAFLAASAVLIASPQNTFILLMMFLSIVMILMNFMYLRLQILSFYSATLIFAMNVYVSQIIILFGTEIRSITIYGFFPAVIGGLLFLGTRLGTLYAFAYLIALWCYHWHFNTPHIEFFMQFLALMATFLIALFYEIVSNYHSELLSSTLEEAKTLAQIDQLTGILNRREFLYQVGMMEEKYEAYTMVMIDIDNFKSINDTYGHAIGDSALKLITQTIKSHIRESEPFGRIGGEEFAIMFPLSLSQAYDRSEEIRNAVEESKLMREKIDLRMTISIGLAFAKEISNIDEMLCNADKALYEAKKEGKNQVKIWSE